MPLRTSAGFTIDTAYGLAALKSADLVIMPSRHDDCREAPTALLDAPRQAHHRGARVVGLMPWRAFPSAQAGLLDGRTATNPLGMCRYAGGTISEGKRDPDVLYVDQGDVLTSGRCVAAGIDCCLHLLRQISGAEAANHRAKEIAGRAPPGQGGQALLIERPLPVTNSDGRLSQVV
ncbi:hypothetical protein ACTMU2_05260 [Cupriavidus basilensis]